MSHTDPEYLRLQDVADEAQAAMYDHLKKTDGLGSTIVAIVVWSRAEPGMVALQAAGASDDDIIWLLKGVIASADAGCYRLVERPTP